MVSWRGNQRLPRKVRLFKCLEGDPHPSIALVDQIDPETPSPILSGLIWIRQACVAGLDFGATVAWQLLAFYPERVKAAAILNVPHPLVMQRGLTSSFAQLRRS